MAHLHLTGWIVAYQKYVGPPHTQLSTHPYHCMATPLPSSALCEQAALEHCTFVDSKGLVCASRLEGLQHHKRPFAHDLPFCPDLKSAMRLIKPSVLIGESIHTSCR